ncbi:hypothetical protein EHS25_004918 [Saitozyma podzolica]|uniref:Uncharacterized protein n=1 Tax=Saitozyma podzolica TaxID=1890683 RepID=A0A427Y336_9TREE|nr:hypothetical protein EHS25_004918 [Saitozyma podzolica]
MPRSPPAPRGNYPDPDSDSDSDSDSSTSSTEPANPARRGLLDTPPPHARRVIDLTQDQSDSGEEREDDEQVGGPGIIDEDDEGMEEDVDVMLGDFGEGPEGSESSMPGRSGIRFSATFLSKGRRIVVRAPLMGEFVQDIRTTSRSIRYRRQHHPRLRGEYFIHDNRPDVPRAALAVDPIGVDAIVHYKYFHRQGIVEEVMGGIWQLLDIIRERRADQMGSEEEQEGDEVADQDMEG